MTGITRFEARGNTYTFPTNPGDQDFRTNFGELVARTSRMPGVSGGFDEYGSGRAPSAVGNIQFSFWLVSDTLSGMQALRDAVYPMADWGAGRLIQTMQDGTERWAWARVNNITMSEKRHMHSDLFQQVQMSFQASNPYWYRPGNEAVWDGAATAAWDNASAIWDGGAGTSITDSGTISVTNAGSATTLARVIIHKNSAGTCWNPIVRRVVNGAVVDEVRWSYGVGAGSYVDINPRAQRVQWVLYTTNVVYDGYALGYFEAKHPDWMRLAPGVNSIQVLMDGSATVSIKYLERYL